jgi:hypothetical protein
MRPANGFVRRATLAACALLLVAVVGAAGCASPPPAPIAAARPARVELVNLSECDWRVTFATAAGRGPRTMVVAARETARLELAGGDYAITQTALAGLVGPETSRQFSAHLAAGEAYRWRLLTLLSATAIALP